MKIVERRMRGLIYTCSLLAVIALICLAVHGKHIQDGARFWNLN